MLVRVGNAKDVVDNEMHVFDVEGTKVNIASALSLTVRFTRTRTRRQFRESAGSHTRCAQV